MGFILFLFLSVAQTDSLQAAETIKVGGYVFPPFVERLADHYSGLTLDLIEAMNDYQKTYRFTFVSTSAKRRYRDFDEGEYDMIFFESIAWGWGKKTAVHASKVFLKGGEVYITKASSDKSQGYFNDFKGKSIAGYLGYHYGFAGFNADERFLREKFNVELSSTHEGNILRVLRDRVDMAVVTKSYLDTYLKKHPEHKALLLISSRLDQTYKHTILLRKNKKPFMKEMNKLLTDMEKSGILDRLWEKYGITREME